MACGRECGIAGQCPLSPAGCGACTLTRRPPVIGPAPSQLRRPSVPVVPEVCPWYVPRCQHGAVRGEVGAAGARPRGSAPEYTRLPACAPPPRAVPCRRPTRRCTRGARHCQPVCDCGRRTTVGGRAPRTEHVPSQPGVTPCRYFSSYRGPWGSLGHLGISRELPVLIAGFSLLPEVVRSSVY